MPSATRFAELSYERQGDLWRIVTTDDGNSVGPHYKSKAELLADLERYATGYGCANALPPDMKMQRALEALRLAECELSMHRAAASNPEAWEDAIKAVRASMIELSA